MPERAGATVYLHIGRGKAGSSSLQRLAANNREALEAAGVRYPQLGGAPGPTHARVAKALRADSRVGDDGLDELARLVRDLPAQRILLSSEYFAELPGEALARLRGILGERPVRVIQYVRPYHEWMVSVYAQRTKKGRNVLDFDAFCARAQAFSAVPSVLRWAATFGLASLRVRMLDPADLVDGSLVPDFLDAIEARVVVTAKRENRAPPWYALEAARWCIVREAPATERERKALGSGVIRHVELAGVQAGAAAKTQYLTPDQAATLARRFDADMAAIGAHVGRRFPPARILTTARPFLPSAAFIPTQVLDTLRRRLADPATRPRPPRAVEALEALVEAAEGSTSTDAVGHRT